LTDRLAIVVPTRNRPAELTTLLANLEAQSGAPDAVIVVDSSDEPLRGEVEAIVGRARLPCTYLRHLPPSAAAQRNAGLNAALASAELIAFLDDDLTLDARALESASTEIARSGAEFIGFGFNPVDADSRRDHGMLKKLRLTEALGLYSGRTGAVSPSGWHTRLMHVEEPTEVEWLLSGAVIWRANAIGDLRFDEYFEQYSYLEDLEFSLQARRRGRFLVLSSATYLHTPAPGGRKSRFWFGRIEVRNRYYIVRKHRLSRWRFWLGTAIRCAITLGTGLTSDRRELGRFWGNVSEMGRILRPRIDLRNFRVQGVQRGARGKGPEA